MNRRVRVTAKRRREIDVDKLVAALLRILEAERSRLAVHFSSASDEWPTPDDLFARLNGEFGFTLDPCATRRNAKTRRYFTRAADGLRQRWSGSVFMNPPYGRVIGDWIAKAHSESQRGALVVCLIPSRTDTRYWHDYVMRADEIRFVRGRLRFGGGAHPAPFPSAVVVFRPGTDGPPAVRSIQSR